MRLTRIEQSPNYRDGKFHNLEVTPELTEGYSMLGVLYRHLFSRAPRRKPTGVMPSVKTDLHALPADLDILIWFGHSSYFLQVSGVRILVDPVFSGNASPIPGINRAFVGTDVYGVDDLPAIDYLFVSHDHYDHLDYLTVRALRPKVGAVVCGLGVGAHFAAWGYAEAVLHEVDWYDTLPLAGGLTLHVTPARHFSGRGMVRNTTLWCSFVLHSPSLRLYLGGDSGYGPHFREIGDAFGPFDLAILDNGQYDVAWRYIHLLPEEVLRAARDLNAERLLPVHSGKFVLANHAWDEPLERTLENKPKNFPGDILTPRIGEVVWLGEEGQVFGAWWRGVA